MRADVYTLKSSSKACHNASSTGSAKDSLNLFAPDPHHDVAWEMTKNILRFGVGTRTDEQLRQAQLLCEAVATEQATPLHEALGDAVQRCCTSRTGPTHTPGGRLCSQSTQHRAHDLYPAGVGGNPPEITSAQLEERCLRRERAGERRIRTVVYQRLNHVEPAMSHRNMQRCEAGDQGVAIRTLRQQSCNLLRIPVHDRLVQPLCRSSSHFLAAEQHFLA